ncbi:MAG: hypothetical protein QOG53_3049 [Frankiales bacterium]|nr:hypothetical protein [Frankiales bacterium]
MTSREPRAQAAYAELILALVDARADPATTRFDHELAQAIEDGRIDPETARTLRWWQRESVRGVRDHLADVLPPLLGSLEAAAAQAATDAQSSEELWRDTLSGASTKPETTTDVSAERATESGQDVASQPRVLNLPIDLTDRRRRMVVAGLVSASGATAPRGASQEGRR